MKKIKLYLVKREVRARSITEAMEKDGDVYEVSLADEKFQPEDVKEVAGFKKK